MSKLPLGFDWIEKKKCYRYRKTIDGKSVAVYGKTIEECYSKMHEKEEAIKNHMHIDNQKITLNKYYSTWISELGKADKPTTVCDYGKPWRYISKYLGDMRIVKINKTDVLQFQNQVAQDSTQNNANRVIRLLNQILNSAVTDRIIDYNPCTGIKRFKIEKDKACDTNHRALTEQETNIFMRYAENSQYYILFQFLLCSGCRIGEACALNWFDIDFEGKEIRINKTATRLEKGFVILDSPKTESSNRTIPITPDIELLLRRQAEQNRALFGNTCTLVFPNSRGSLANYNSVNNSINAIVKNIGKEERAFFPTFTTHAFRHTFATRCIEQGMSMHTLSKIMGHSSLKVTMDLYAHVLPNTKYQELEKIRFVV